MQNSHLRLGRLEYQRSSVKTNTHIAVHVSHYVGEKEQAHLLSYFGNDAEVAVSTWLHGNGSAGRTFVINDDPSTQDLVWATLVSLLGVPADPRWGTHLL